MIFWNLNNADQRFNTNKFDLSLGLESFLGVIAVAMITIVVYFKPSFSVARVLSVVQVIIYHAEKTLR